MEGFNKSAPTPGGSTLEDQGAEGPRILCLCAAGITRSAATKFVLNHRGYRDVLSAGIYTTSPSTLDMLYKWADIILVATPILAVEIPQPHRDKVDNRFKLGEDTWGNPMSVDLLRKVGTILNTCGLLPK